MCDPISLIGLAISTATSVVGYQAEKAGAEQQNQLYRENAANANAAAKQQQFDVNQRKLQEQESAAAEKIDIVKEHRAAKASAEVAAGEAGVTGLSVDAIMRDILGQQSQAVDRVDQQTEWSLNQLNSEMRAIHAQNKDRINGVQRAAAPSFINTGLAIGASAIGSYGDAKSRENTLGKGWWKK